MRKTKFYKQKNEKWFPFRLFCISVFFAQIGLLNLSATNMPPDTLSLNLRNVKMETFVEVMQQKTGLNFLYNALLFKDMKPVTEKATGERWEAVLKRVLQRSGLTYDLKDGIVVITRSKTSATDETEKRKPLPPPTSINGKVVDEREYPVPGANVIIKGTLTGTATDTDGCFSLNVREGVDTLVVRFMGMETQYVCTEKNMKEYLIVMYEEMSTFDDVVITGYGNRSRSNYTGAATTVRAEDVILPGSSTIDQMLQGVIPGMQVQHMSGMVGTTPKIRVRGASTLLGSQEPLWVVDGVVQQNPQPFNVQENTRFTMDADDIRKLAGNAISWLNPHDIETITVLKDASATAIYGSQAANGVIVVTTKKASPGKISISYNSGFSVGQRPNFALYDRMNSEEMMQFSKEMHEERVSYPVPVLPIGYAGLLHRMINKKITMEEMNAEYQKMARQNTDWFDLLFHNSLNHKQALSISGGSQTAMNRTSFNIDREMGEAKGNNLFSFGIMSNTEINPFRNLTVNLSLSGNTRKVKGFAYEVDPFSYAYGTTRVIPAYNPDGSLYYHEKWGGGSSVIQNKRSYNYNILNELDNTGSINETRNWGATLDVNWKLMPGLQYMGVASYSSSSSETKRHATERSFFITSLRGYEYATVLPNSIQEKSTRIPHGGVLDVSHVTVEAMMTRHSLSYNKLFDEKHLTLLSVGAEASSTKTTGSGNTRYGYLKDRGETFAILPITYYAFGDKSQEAENKEFAYPKTTVLNRKNNLFSAYAQAVYSYDDRYVLNVSARMDASNRFGQDRNKRFAPTWSAGVRWNAGNEAFLRESDWVNGLDMTASYGYQGNAVANVSPYLIAKDGGLHSYYNSNVLLVQSLPYPNLGWEKTRSFNLGVNASFLNGRINAGIDYFGKESDVLSSRDIPIENGMNNAVVSGSRIRNTGYEFTVEVIPVHTTDFSWSISLNSSVTKNRITKNDRINTLADFLSGSAIVEGEPFSTFYSYRFKGLDAKDGTPLFHDIDKKSVKNRLEHLVRSGKFTPDFSGGLNMMFKYRNWTLYTLFSVRWGGMGRLPVLYQAHQNNGVPTPEQNLSRKIINRWKKEGDNTTIPSIPGVGKTRVFLPQEGDVFSKIQENSYNMYNLSDARVATTDMIRCNSISLSYEFNPERLPEKYLSRLSIMLSMQNPFIWARDKKWEGIDPETGNWPARRVVSLSLQAAF